MVGWLGAIDLGAVETVLVVVYMRQRVFQLMDRYDVR